MCQCEDRPCCGCDADVYQPYDQDPPEQDFDDFEEDED